MVPQSGERFNRFLQAQKRTRDDGAEERYCTICQTWDGRKQSAWYKHHGLGKCTPPANPLSPEDPEDAWDASGGVYEGMYADGAEGPGQNIGAEGEEPIAQGLEEGGYSPTSRDELSQSS